MLEDDRRFRKALAEEFADKGYNVIDIGSLKDLENKFFDYAVIDLRLLAESGLVAIPELLFYNPSCRIIILSGYGSVATAVEAIKLGAINYLNKPASCELIEAALKDQIKDKDLDPFQVAPLSQHEHEYIDFVLSKNDGNITKTAKQLGLHRQSLQRKLKKYP